MPMQWKPSLSAALLVLGVFIYTGCGRSQTVVQQDSQGQYADAVRIYQSACITCHGDNLQGGVGPGLTHVGSTLTPAQLIHQIDAGGGSMPGYGPDHLSILSTQQIQRVAEWLGTKK